MTSDNEMCHTAKHWLKQNSIFTIPRFQRPVQAQLPVAHTNAIADRLLRCCRNDLISAIFISFFVYDLDN